MSTVKFNTWQNTDGTENYKCRAWVNFDGTGTPSIRESGNVSSITDEGTGQYTVNFTTAMPDTNYALIGSCGDDSFDRTRDFGGPSNLHDTYTTSAIAINIDRHDTVARSDMQFIYAAVFR